MKMKPISVTLEGLGVEGKVLELRGGRYWIGRKKLSDPWRAMVDGVILLAYDNFEASTSLCLLLESYIGKRSYMPLSKGLEDFTQNIRDEYEWTG